MHFIKKTINLFIAIILLLYIIPVYAQPAYICDDTISGKLYAAQNIGIVISSNDPETVWNAFRLANFATEQGDSVSVFLLGKGVESASVNNDVFNVTEMMETFSNNGGIILACGTCLQIRKEEGTKLCPVSSLSDLYRIIKSNEIILTF